MRLRGTLAPFSRASDRPIAIACLRLLTLPPFPPGPLRSVPFLRRRIALSTRLLALLPYFLPLEDFLPLDDRLRAATVPSRNECVLSDRPIFVQDVRRLYLKKGMTSADDSHHPAVSSSSSPAELTDTDTVNDTVLIDRIRAGDKAAFESLFKKYFRELHAYARAYLKSDQDAEDVVQDVFARIWGDRESWHVHSGVKAYLVTMVRNRTLNVIRNSKASTRRDEKYAAVDEGPVATSPGTAHIEETELRRYIARAVEALPPRCREVFLLSRVRHLTQREIADTLGIALPTVKVQLGKAFRAIAEACREYDEDITRE